MKPEEIYISQVLSHLPEGAMRNQIAMELRSHIAERVERGQSVEEAIRQLGDPAALAESYLSAVPLVSAPHLRRLAAKFVDLILPIAITCGLGALYLVGLRRFADRSALDWAWGYLPAVLILVCATLAWFYLVLAEYYTGQTLGKHLFGLRVVRESGARIGLGQAFVRQLPILLQIFWIDALFALFTDRRQRAFELLTKTRVVRVQEVSVAPHVPVTSQQPAML
jgi:uncharacterized RDD family membrane protein YckC